MMPEYDHTRSYDHNYDQIVSLGEIMSTQIVAVFLLKSGIPTEWWNMPKLLRTDHTYREAQVDMLTSAQVIRAGWDRPNRPKVVVAQGFIGGTADGYRTTLGREGSDYTAALMGNFLDAESVTIWKDVPGILNADPRLVANTVKIDRLTYYDAVELAYSGAQVIHPKTIRPLENKSIPLYVKPFGDYTAPGSVITAEADSINVPVYIWRTNQVLITLRAKDFSFVLEESLTHIFNIIHQNRLKVSLIQSSAVTISVCVDNSRFVQPAIQQLQEAYRVVWNEGLSLLTIRGTNPEILKREQDGRDIMLSQITRRTAKLVIKD
jgi:aspartate kinase